MVSIKADAHYFWAKRFSGSEPMTARSRLLLAATLAVAVAAPPVAAEAAWWNPFRRDQPAQDAPVPPAGVATPVQAAPAGAPIVTAQGDDAAMRLDRAEAQMRAMTGQLEELTHQLKQLQEQMQRMQQDNDFRFQELEGSNSSGRAQPRRSEAAPPAAQPPRRQAAAEPAGAPMDDIAPDEQEAAAVAAPPGRGAPPRDLGQIPATPGAGPDSGAPLDLSALIRREGGGPAAGSGESQQTAALSTGDARADYDAAYQHVLAGDYELAEQGFQAFLASYPADRMAGDAQYWLGESLYARGMYKEAAAQFLNGFKTYPDNPRAPDTLLKLGMSLQGLGEKDAACASYAQVLKQFPNVSGVLKERVKSEQASARC